MWRDSKEMQGSEGKRNIDRRQGKLLTNPQQQGIGYGRTQAKRDLDHRRVRDILRFAGLKPRGHYKRPRQLLHGKSLSGLWTRGSRTATGGDMGYRRKMVLSFHNE